MKNNIFYFIILVIAVAMSAGCGEYENSPFENTGEGLAEFNGNSPAKHYNLPKELQRELQQAKNATARYNNINNAIADGYEDINVVVPNMGHHYMKEDIVNAEFEIDKPEILVYSPHPVSGKMRLVAVEYAVPLNNPEPEGFTGEYDEWDENKGFGLWLLHAWVWEYNPDGVFAPMNPLVP